MKRSILSALCLVLSISALAGCSGNREPFEERRYTPESQVNELTLDVRDREIEVSPSGDRQLHIQYSENSKEYYSISLSDDYVLTMTSVSGKGWSDYIGLKPPAGDRKISLQIPNALLENLTLSTTNGDITVSELAVSGRIDISSNGGNITFGGLDVGTTLSLTVKNGDISGAVIGGYEDFAIQSKVKKGQSNLPEEKEGGEKALNVSCNNGDISIDFQSK